MVAAPPRCPYCGQSARLVAGRTLYPKDPALTAHLFWRCDPCGAHVGTHRDGKPLGTLADAATRRHRARAHQVFDSLWREGTRSRAEAYAWLAEQMGLSAEDCHIAKFDAAQCRRVVEIVRGLGTFVDSDFGPVEDDA